MSDQPHEEHHGEPQPEHHAEPPPVSPEDEQALVDSRYRGSRGGQVLLHPDSDAALGARGGAAGTVEENTLVRDMGLLAHSVHPYDPDATHLTANIIPPGGEVMDKVSDEHEPAFVPPPEATPTR